MSETVRPPRWRRFPDPRDRLIIALFAQLEAERQTRETLRMAIRSGAIDPAVLEAIAEDPIPAGSEDIAAWSGPSLSASGSKLTANRTGDETNQDVSHTRVIWDCLTAFCEGFCSKTRSGNSGCHNEKARIRSGPFLRMVLAVRRTHSVTKLNVRFREPPVNLGITLGAAIPGIIGPHCLQLQPGPLTLVAVGFSGTTQCMAKPLRAHGVKLEARGSLCGDRGIIGVDDGFRQPTGTRHNRDAAIAQGIELVRPQGSKRDGWMIASEPPWMRCAVGSL